MHMQEKVLYGKIPFITHNPYVYMGWRLNYEKVCLCLAFVLAAVCILCSCSDLPAPSTSETVNPSVDVTLKKWEDCGASIDKAEEISGIKFGEV